MQTSVTTPGLSALGIVENPHKERRAQLIENIRYESGTRFIGAYKDSSGKPVKVYVNIPADKLGDLTEAFAATIWQHADGGDMTAHIAALQSALPAFMTENFYGSGEKYSFQIEQPRIIGATGDLGGALQYTLTGSADIRGAAVTVQATFTGSLPAMPDDSHKDDFLHMAYNAVWTIKQPESITIDQYARENWVMTECNWYLNGAHVEVVTGSVVFTRLEANPFTGKPYTDIKEIKILVQPDTLLYASVKDSAAAFYLESDYRAAAAKTFASLKKAQAANEPIRENINTQVAAYREKLESEQPSLHNEAVLAATYGVIEANLKAAWTHHFVTGKTEQKTSPDGVLQVAVTPKVKINDMPAVVAFCKERLPDVVIEVIDESAFTKTVLAKGVALPNGAVRADTVTPKIISDALLALLEGGQ